MNSQARQHDKIPGMTGDIFEITVLHSRFHCWRRGSACSSACRWAPGWRFASCAGGASAQPDQHRHGAAARGGGIGRFHLPVAQRPAGRPAA